MNFHENDTEIHKQPKFIVFQNQLLLLLSICLACFSKEVAVYHIVKGSMLTAYIKCLCCKTVKEWKSQPEIRNYAAGDILLSGATRFNGSLPNKFLHALMSIKIACISPRTFFRHQGKFLHGAVRAKQQNDLFDKIRGQGLLVGGDGRSDSMGHSAKYGSYTTVDLKRNKILHDDFVRSNEVKSSAHMELKGLQNTEVFKDSGLKLSALVTDRHRQIQKWVRENMVGVLHIAKSIKKMLCSVMKKKSLQYNWKLVEIYHKSLLLVSNIY